MQKGISTIIAGLLLVLVTVSMASAFLIFSSSAFTQLGQSGTQSQQRFLQESAVVFNIEAVGSNVVSLRNRGSTALDTRNLTFYVDEKPATHTDVTIAAGGVGTINITNLWNFGPGFHNLRVSGGSLSDSVRFESVPAVGTVLDLRFEEGNGTTAGDSSGLGNNGNIIAGGRNLMKNAGFESDGFWGFTGAGGTAAFSSAQTHSGTRSGALTKT